MGFRAPGKRTAAFFAQAGQQNTKQAQDELTRGQAVKNVQQAGTNVRQAEAQNVAQKSQNVAGTAVNYGDEKLNQANTTVQNTPVYNTGNVLGLTELETPEHYVNAYGGNQNKLREQFKKGPLNTIIIDTPSGPIRTSEKELQSITYSDATFDKNKALNDANYQYNQALNSLTSAINTNTAGADNLRKLEDLYLGEQSADLAKKEELDKKVAEFRRLAGDNNYGQVGRANAMDLESQAFLKQLAEKNPSNLGLLASLYGSNYDAGKYGALDSQLLQGALNQMRQGAEGQLQARDIAQGSMQKSLEDYYRTTDEKGKEVQSKYDVELEEIKNSKLARDEKVAVLENTLADLRNQLDQVKNTSAAKMVEKAIAKTQKLVSQISSKNKTEAQKKLADLVKKRNTSIAKQKEQNAKVVNQKLNKNETKSQGGGSGGKITGKPKDTRSDNTGGSGGSVANIDNAAVGYNRRGPSGGGS